MLNNLKKLKQRIKTNQKELEQIHPHTQSVLETITMLIQKRASDDMIKLWIDGGLHLLIDIEDTLKYIEYHQKLDLKNQLKTLKIKIDTNIKKLEIKYPISRTISEAIEILLNMDAPEDMIRPYLNGIEDFIKDIDVELEYL